MPEKTHQIKNEAEIALNYANSIISTLKESFLVINNNLQIVSANQAFYNTFKVTEKETIGQLLPDLGNHQWNIPKLIRLLKEILPKEMIVVDYEVEHKFETIGYRVMNLNARQLRISKKIVTLLTTRVKKAVVEKAVAEVAEVAEKEEEELTLLAIEDITERKEAEQKIKQSEEKFETIFEDSRGGILLVNTVTNKFTMANKAICDMLGYTKEEVLHLEVDDIYPSKDLPFVLKKFEKQAKGEIKLLPEIPIKRKDGSIIYTDVNTAPLIINEKKYLMKNFRDITERREIEQAKNDFLNIASHEMKTPMATIKGYLSIMLEGLGGKFDQKGKEHLIKVSDGVKRLDVLASDLLDVSRLEKGGMKFNLQPYDVSKIIDDSKMTFKNKAIEKKLILEEEKLSQTPLVLIDKDRFRQVIDNLISNALKYTQKGAVTISYKIENGNLFIIIKDTGIGMNEEDCKKLFTKFYRIKNEKTVDISGTGLGLWISREIVRKMKGDILVNSTENVGSQFIIKLPCLKEK